MARDADHVSPTRCRESGNADRSDGMSHERWFRSQHAGQGRSFEWLTLTRWHGAPSGRARSLYKLAI